MNAVMFLCGYATVVTWGAARRRLAVSGWPGGPARVWPAGRVWAWVPLAFGAVFAERSEPSGPAWVALVCALGVSGAVFSVLAAWRPRWLAVPLWLGLVVLFWIQLAG